ncbi:hypothetical protein [Catenuloplanes atrovinosus]|uniref:Uncharacterized protein n=1 Tax=Catenuloplanes atrovinosus TaxID=137266 RepID=A0AAE4CCC9_9ACTN|nr:hypothetical protein [Catenuloplanes atrovinosus]MDR7277844.1 hypothetical protein [Catenuloplanes atrovinosus]
MRASSSGSVPFAAASAAMTSGISTVDPAQSGAISPCPEPVGASADPAGAAASAEFGAPPIAGAGESPSADRGVVLAAQAGRSPAAAESPVRESPGPDGGVVRAGRSPTVAESPVRESPRAGAGVVLADRGGRSPTRAESPVRESPGVEGGESGVGVRRTDGGG